MPSDLNKKAEPQEPKKASAQILKEEIAEGLHVFARSPRQLFFSGLSAGLDVGFSLFLMAVMKTRLNNLLPAPVSAILVANMYSVGFIFVVLGRSELFTEQTTLAVLPVLSGDADLKSLARLWSIVYVSNLIGAAAFAGITVIAGPALGVIEPKMLGEIAHHMTDHYNRRPFMNPDNPTGAAPYGRKTQKPSPVKEIHVLWITAGLSCDGDSVSITAATQPSIEDVLLGAIPGLPKVHLHNPVLAYENGDEFLKFWYEAEAGRLDPFVLVLEGSVPNEKIKSEGYWAALGTDKATGQPITTCSWIDRLAPKALAIIACGTCATYGGIHAMEGNPTGAMGLADYLGWDWKSKAGLPIVNVPGCPVQPDNFMETLLYLLYQVAGLAPMIPLDDNLRPKWLFGATVHDGCDRAGYYEQGDFTQEYGSPKCLVKIGCWGPVVNCNVPKRGWMAGIGGCPNVGGICIGCTMPGFPDKFMPFMDEPPGARLSTHAIAMYGRTIRALRSFTNQSVNKEPKWRHPGKDLTTGYKPTSFTPA